MGNRGDLWRMGVSVLLFCSFVHVIKGLPISTEKRQTPPDYGTVDAAVPYAAPPDAPPPLLYPEDVSVYSNAVGPVQYTPPDMYYQMSQPMGYSGMEAFAIPGSLQYPATTINPYGQPMDSMLSMPQPYPAIMNPYAVSQPYPAIMDPYSQQLLMAPGMDPYQMMAAYQVQPQQPSTALDPYFQSLALMQPGLSSSMPPPQTSPSLYQPPTYQQSPMPMVVEQDTYLAVTNNDLNSRRHCGILPATNDNLYNSDPLPGGVNDVVPYGQFPWLVLIVDKDDYSVVCLGTMVQTEGFLTASSCITKPASRYTVVRDWDILTMYNEYEPYRSYGDQVCRYFRIGVDNSTGQSQYRLGDSSSDLILLVGNLEDHVSQYPADKILCLPTASSALPSPYSTPYGQPVPPPPSPYSVPYGPPPPPPPSPYTMPYPQLSYSTPLQNAECWVAGYRNSPNAILQNHPPATPAMSYGPQPQQAYQQQQNYSQQYYGTLDNSKVPRRALVRQIQCPQNYPNAGYDDVCFVGVNGFDACVADKGTAIVCVINDDTNYQSGFADDPTRAVTPPPYGMQPPNNAAYPQQQQQYQQQPIQLLPAPPKQKRRRGIIYGVVKTTTACMSSPAPVSQYQQPQQSNYIVAARVSPSIKSAIQDLFWEGVEDKSCASSGVRNSLQDEISGSSVGSPPLPYSITSSLQPQQYDPSLSQMSVYTQPPPSYSMPPPVQYAPPMGQVSYSG